MSARSDMRREAHLTAVVRNKAGLTSDEKRDWIALLRSEGKTDQQIADYLDMERSVITKIRNALGYGPVGGERPQKVMTEQRKAIVCLHDDWGYSFVEISRLLGLERKGGPGISDLYYTEKEAEKQRHAKAAQPTPIEKKCLRCQKPFLATDRKREWYCAIHRDHALTYGDFADEYRIAS